jgi:hypothetical protein
MTFTKLFSSITESTIWREPANVRLVWITMLAMADRRGRVWASLPGLADRARVPDEDCRAAIKTFLSPDADSRTREHEGRRIEVIDGGWRLLNHEKYRAIRDEEAIKDSKRNYINKRRAAEKQSNVENVERGRTPSNDVSQCRANAESEADADAKEKEVEPPAPFDCHTCSAVFGDDEQMPGEPKQEKKAPSFTTQFIEAWCESFLSVRGEKYLVCKGKDHAAAKRIASMGMPIADLIALARRAWASSGPKFWRCEKAITISFFVGSFNEIRAELSAKPTTSNAIHSKNPAEHPRNRFIAGAGTGPSTSEIIKRNNERAAAERAAREAERVPAPTGPMAGEVAPVEEHPSAGFGSV